MDSYSSASGEKLSIKMRKLYTVTKQRERWIEEEHNSVLEALKLYGRAWARIEEHIGTKTAFQIGSHAQKFFTKFVNDTCSVYITHSKEEEAVRCIQSIHGYILDVISTMSVQEHSGSDKSCVWHAADVSDSELKDERFCIRFASVDNCKKFMETFQEVAESQKDKEENKDASDAARLLDKLTVEDKSLSELKRLAAYAKSSLNLLTKLIVQASKILMGGSEFSRLH